MKKELTLLSIIVLFLSLLIFISAQDSSDYVGSSGTSSTTTAAGAAATGASSTLPITGTPDGKPLEIGSEKKDVTSTIAQGGATTENGGMKAGEVEAQNLRVTREKDAKTTTIDFKENGDLKFNGLNNEGKSAREYKNIAPADDKTKAQIKLDSDGKTVEADLKTKEDSRMVIGNQEFTVPKGAKVLQKDGKISVDMTGLKETPTLKDIPKRAKTGKKDEEKDSGDIVSYIGKFKLPEGTLPKGFDSTVEGVMNFRDGQFFSGKDPVSVGNLQFGGNVKGSNFINSENHFFTTNSELKDFKLPEGFKGSYTIFGENNGKTFIQHGSNNDLYAQALAMKPGNNLMPGMKENMFAAIQPAGNSNFIGERLTSESGKIFQGKLNGDGVYATDYSSFKSIDGKVYFNPKTPTIMGFGNSEKSNNYPSEIGFFDKTGNAILKSSKGPNEFATVRIASGDGTIGKAYSVMNSKETQWSVGGQTFSNDLKSYPGMEGYQAIQQPIQPIPETPQPPVSVNPNPDLRIGNIPRKYNSGKTGILGDIEDRLEKPFKENNPITEAHENTHKLNEKLGNNLNVDTGERTRGFYMLDGKYSKLKGPKISLQDSLKYLPPNVNNGKFENYLKETVYSDDPLYAFDEWTSYINGANSGVESYKKGQGLYGRRDILGGPASFNLFSLSLSQAVANGDPNYWKSADGQQFREFVKYNMERSVKIIDEGTKTGQYDPEYITPMNNLKTSPNAESLRQFTRENFGADWTKRVLGF